MEAREHDGREAEHDLRVAAPGRADDLPRGALGIHHSSGSVAPRLNQVDSASWRPLKNAWRCEPVRINPGTIVTTRTPVPRSSARNPSDSATAANLAQLYGTRCGMLTFPPIDVTLTTRASRAARRWGSAARVGWRAPQN